MKSSKFPAGCKNNNYDKRILNVNMQYTITHARCLNAKEMLLDIEMRIKIKKKIPRESLRNFDKTRFICNTQ